VIPRLYHFFVGFEEGQPFDLRHHLAVASAVRVNDPCQTFIRYVHEPAGEWWEKTKTLDSVSTGHVVVPDAVQGRPLRHYAHRCDVARLLILKEMGGVYLDIDTVCLRPFGDLHHEKCVMGRQKSHRGKAESHGLCNAVLLSERQGSFVKRWLHEYHWFRSRGRDPYWDEHSVQVPLRLSRGTPPGELTVLGERAFFFPLWDQMEFLFESEEPHWFAESYAVHLWESLTAEKWLNRMTPQWLAESPCNLARIARETLPA
jgi:hypothetical protein